MHAYKVFHINVSPSPPPPHQSSNSTTINGVLFQIKLKANSHILLPSMSPPSPPSSIRKLLKLLPFLFFSSLAILVLFEINVIPYFSSQPTSPPSTPQPPMQFLFKTREHPLQEPPQTPQSSNLSNSNDHPIRQSPPRPQTSNPSPPSIPTTPPTQRPEPPGSRAPRDLLESLQPTPKSVLFSTRAQRFFTGNSSSCSARFFMTWFSPVVSFTARELLTVESLFKAHKDAACLLILSATLDSPEGQRILQPFEDLGFKVAALSPDYPFLLHGTPADGWFRRLLQGLVSPGKISLGQNLSNLFRLAVLYKYGGTYLDADVIVMRSFGDLRNVIGAQSVDATGNWTTLNTAVLVFDRRHPLLLEFIREYAETFDGSRWGHNGPDLVTRVMRRGVGVEGVRVVGLEAFYPVNWTGIAGWFRKPRDERERRSAEETVRRVRDRSYGVHLWNAVSKGIAAEEGSVIKRIAGERCLLCNHAPLRPRLPSSG